MNTISPFSITQSQSQQQNRVKIAVRNWQNATMQDLLSFITRHARLSLQDPAIEGPLVVGFLQTKEQADQVLKLNGAQFAGNKLKLEIVDADKVSNTSSTIEFFRAFLARRYDPNTRMLDLSSLYADPELIQKGMFANVSIQSRLFPAMLKVASKEQQLNVVESVNLADNKLRDITNIASLAQTFPNLKNLCLANNQIARHNALEGWKNKFKSLRELLMTNNPITTNSSTYVSDMLKIFPKLVILDNNIVRDNQKLEAIFSLPVKPQQFFFENDQLTSSSTGFVTNFLTLWDSDRSQLLNLYTPQSQFSLSVDSSVPPSTVNDSDQTPSFGFYIPQSRNVCKVSSEKSLEQRLAMGQERIATLFKQLPSTKHHLMDDPNGYSMEAVSYPQVNGFIIMLHGYFEETAKPEVAASSGSGGSGSSNATGHYSGSSRHRRYGGGGSSHSGSSSSANKLGKKSFDRTWVIVPMDNSLVVASDMLTVRAYTSNAWTPNLQQQQQQTPNPPLVGAQQQVPSVVQTLQLPPEVQQRLNPGQLELLHKLHIETKLNAEYTYMLAEQSGWNYENAVKSFQSSVNNLPREAFV